MPPQINLQELYNMQKKKIKNRSKCFDYIIELCHRRIRNVSSYNGQNTFYEIPGFVVGFPLYNLNECITYVVDALRKNGFLIQILPPPNIGVIYISWDPREIKQQKLLEAPPPQLSINSNKLPQKSLLTNKISKNHNTNAQANYNGYRDQMRLF
jgi:hypothetical protein